MAAGVDLQSAALGFDSRTLQPPWGGRRPIAILIWRQPLALESLTAYNGVGLKVHPSNQGPAQCGLFLFCLTLDSLSATWE